MQLETEEIIAVLEGTIENLVALQLLSTTSERAAIDYGKALEPITTTLNKVKEELEKDLYILAPFWHYFS